MDLDSFFVPTNSLVACARKEGKESQKEIQTSWKLGYVKDCVFQNITVSMSFILPHEHVTISLLLHSQHLEGLHFVPLQPWPLHV